ncbi:MAG: hypothetical protein ABII27_04050 [bacterium]
MKLAVIISLLLLLLSNTIIGYQLSNHLAPPATIKKDQTVLFNNAKEKFPYTPYPLIIEIAEDYELEYSTIGQMEYELLRRNWFWAHMSDRSKFRGLMRLNILLSKLPKILNLELTKNILTGRRLIAVTTAGSFLWHKFPGDIDLHLIIEGEKDFEKHQLSPNDASDLNFVIDGSITMTDITLQLIGIENMKRAALDEDITDGGDLQRKLLTLYGNGVRLAGVDLFERSAPPLDNLYVLKYHLRQLTEVSTTDKKIKRLFEANAIKNFILMRLIEISR